MMAPHSKDIHYGRGFIKDDLDLKETISKLKLKGDLPEYIVIRKTESRSRKDDGYDTTSLLVYDTKSKTFDMFYYYAKNPFEWMYDALRVTGPHGSYSGEPQNVDEAIDAFYENLQAAYADSLLRKKKSAKPKSKRKPVKRVIKKCKCKS